MALTDGDIRVRKFDLPTKEWALFIIHNLAEVVIPGGVTSIGPFAFEQCANLKKLVIPVSVTSIGNDLLWKSTNAVIGRETGTRGSYRRILGNCL